MLAPKENGPDQGSGPSIRGEFEGQGTGAAFTNVASPDVLSMIVA